eukprot:g37475.t1
MSASTSRKGSCGSVSWWQLGLAAWMVAITAAVVLTNGSAPATNGAKHMMPSAKAKDPEAKGGSDGMGGMGSMGSMGSKGSREGCGYFGKPVTYYLFDGDDVDYVYDGDDNSAEYCDMFDSEAFSLQIVLNTDGTGFLSMADNYDVSELDVDAECLAAGWILTPTVVSPNNDLWPEEEINATCWYNPTGSGRYMFEARPVLPQCLSIKLDDGITDYYKQKNGNPKVGWLLFAMSFNSGGFDRISVLSRSSGSGWTDEDSNCAMAPTPADFSAFNLMILSSAFQLDASIFKWCVCCPSFKDHFSQLQAYANQRKANLMTARLLIRLFGSAALECGSVIHHRKVPSDSIFKQIVIKQYFADIAIFP